MDEKLRCFAENGYVVVQGALSPEEVAAINEGIDADVAAHPKEWEPGPRPGHIAVGTKRQLPKTRDGKSGWGEGVLRIADSETAYVDPDKPIWTDSFGRTNPRRIGRADVHAPAGSAVVFNIASYHCGTVRQTQRIRRTAHLMYRHPDPIYSRHALGPEWESVAAFRAALPKRSAIG